MDGWLDKMQSLYLRLHPPFRLWREIVSEWTTQRALKALDIRIQTILPEEYQDRYDDVQPVSMGSAALKFGSDGKVAWDEIWGTFCDLAMAGGPPHKGVLLEPGTPLEIEAEPERYQRVVDEICRGIFMVSGLTAQPSPFTGWIGVSCASREMAGWLLRAITMENISARCEGTEVFLPAGPQYRLEKEIKNVVTAIAKTCHYWQGHMWRGQQRVISKLFAKLAVEAPLVQPEFSRDEAEADKYQMLCCKMADSVHQFTGLRHSGVEYEGWLGIECPQVRSAIWMMRALVANNALSRREGTVLFVPVNPRSDPDGELVVGLVVRIYHLAVARNVL
jgi:sirohydrochlorin cobaltochelatase